LKLIDVHAHDGVWPHDNPEKYDFCGETMDDFVTDLDRDEVAFCLLSSVAALTEDMIRGNEITYADAALDPRLKAYTYYDPSRTDEAGTEIEKYWEHPEFIGFKSRPSVHSILLDGEGYRPMLEAASEKNLPLLIHSWSLDDAQAMANAAKAYPQVPMILVHACAENWQEAIPMVKPYDNIYVEPVTSTHYPGKVRFILDQVGPERLMFGSDYGLLSRPRVLKYYEEADLSSAEADAVFYGNAKRIFRL
jgi:predicted TIM-barrel fold metal-dependent hydrolase